MNVDLYPHQIEALSKMKNGCILAGDVGTGKSRTALAYFYEKVCYGKLRINGKGSFRTIAHMRDLYIITTAKKRDSLEWEDELITFLLEKGNHVTIDSWNNIKKYKDVCGGFFIFDEQRVVGSGAWVKAFLNITRKNQWILLTATPGDTWSDYIPVFIANRFYRNRTDFELQHCVFSRFSKYKKIEKYIDTGILIKHRNDILVTMEFLKTTTPHKLVVPVEYDRKLYRTVWRQRWDPYEDKPIDETGKLFYLLRKVVNSDPSRLSCVEHLAKRHPRIIIFYNYTHELVSLRKLFTRLNIPIGEWNGESHTDIPSTESWVYLVQYTAGSEGWNCIRTDTIVFFSQSYSYRMTKQAEGRIDRINTPYKDLYYYYLKSSAPIDIAIARALSQKRNFNEKSFNGR